MKKTTTMLLLAAVAGCENSGNGNLASMEGESLPWIAVLADAALADYEENRTGVAARPRVEVAVMPGLPDEHAVALGMVPGAVDREERPRYVIRKKFEGREDLPLPPENEPPVPLPPPARKYGEHSEVSDSAFVAPALVPPEVYRGPWTLILDGIEVDTESRKVAVFSVYDHSPPYVDENGHVTTVPVWNWKNFFYLEGRYLFFQYRVEGNWNGQKWVTNLKDMAFHGVLEEYWPLYGAFPSWEEGQPYPPHPAPGRPWEWVRKFGGSR